MIILFPDLIYREFELYSFFLTKRHKALFGKIIQRILQIIVPPKIPSEPMCLRLCDEEL